MENEIKGILRDIPNWPVEGVTFKDLTPLIASPELFSRVCGRIAYHIGELDIDKVVAVDARGFVFGAPAAMIQGTSLHLARKKGKLPWETISHEYELEYGTDTLEMHKDAILEGEKIMVIDDLLATGGTVSAVNSLVEKMGGIVTANCFVVELSFLGGRRKLNTNVISLAEYD